MAVAQGEQWSWEYVKPTVYSSAVTKLVEEGVLAVVGALDESQQRQALQAVIIHFNTAATEVGCTGKLIIVETEPLGLKYDLDPGNASKAYRKRQTQKQQATGLAEGRKRRALER